MDTARVNLLRVLAKYDGNEPTRKARLPKPRSNRKTNDLIKSCHSQQVDIVKDQNSIRKTMKLSSEHLLENILITSDRK